MSDLPARSVMIAALAVKDGLELTHTHPECVDAILAALAATGYKIVPREVTEHVFCQGDEAIIVELNTHTFALNGGDTPAQKCWRAMWDAIP